MRQPSSILVLLLPLLLLPVPAIGAPDPSQPMRVELLSVAAGDALDSRATLIVRVTNLHPAASGLELETRLDGAKRGQVHWTLPSLAYARSSDGESVDLHTSLDARILPAGSYQLTVLGVDSLGRSAESPAIPVLLTHRNEAPRLTLSSGQHDASSDTFQISGHTEDDLWAVALRIDGELGSHQFSHPGGSFALRIPAPREPGEWRIGVQAVDQDGAVSPTRTATLRIVADALPERWPRLDGVSARYLGGGVVRVEGRVVNNVDLEAVQVELRHSDGASVPREARSALDDTATIAPETDGSFSYDFAIGAPRANNDSIELRLLRTPTHVVDSNFASFRVASERYRHVVAEAQGEAPAAGALALQLPPTIEGRLYICVPNSGSCAPVLYDEAGAQLLGVEETTLQPFACTAGRTLETCAFRTGSAATAVVAYHIVPSPLLPLGDGPIQIVLDGYAW